MKKDQNKPNTSGGSSCLKSRMIQTQIDLSAPKSRSNRSAVREAFPFSHFSHELGKNRLIETRAAEIFMFSLRAKYVTKIFKAIKQS